MVPRAGGLLTARWSTQKWEQGYGKIESGMLRVYESALGGEVLLGPIEYVLVSATHGA